MNKKGNFKRRTQRAFTQMIEYNPQEKEVKEENKEVKEQRNLRNNISEEINKK